jgi:hypothetical protein
MRSIRRRELGGRSRKYPAGYCGSRIEDRRYLKSIKIFVGDCAGVGVQLRDERDHARWQGLGSASRQLGRLDKQRRNDHLLMQRQLAVNLVEQWDRLLTQSLKSRISGILAPAQERDERRRGRDCQRTHIVFGQQRLDAGK